MGLPQNWEHIAAYLMAHGYTPIAAAGILGNIEQESGGDPEAIGSGGGGLIGFTPLPPGYVTGNPRRDLNHQLAAILEYNDAQGRLLVAQLNRSRNPEEAARFYMSRFERPAVATENAPNRVTSANQVYAKLANTQGFSPFDIANFLEQGLTGSAWLNPAGTANAVVKTGGILPTIGNDIARVGKYVLAAGLVGVGVYFIGRRENIIPAPSSVAQTAAKATPTGRVVTGGRKLPAGPASFAEA